jgi:sulfane dehydrogenase subunit SoxC
MTLPFRELPAATGGRRRFLRRGLTSLLATPAAALAALPDRDHLPPWMREPGGADQAYGLPAPHEQAVQRSLSPDGAGFPAWHTPLEQLRGTITPNGLHFAVHHNGIPQVDPQAHELVIHGLVDRPLRFDVERLLRYPLVSRVLFIECSGNSTANAMSPLAKPWTVQALSGQVSCSEWTGVPLSLLLREAGTSPRGRWAVAEGADGGSHQRSIPMDKLMADAMVALYQNGERLRASQGYPMRLVLPGWEGNTQVKWLHRIEVSDQPAHSKDEAGLYTEVLADGRIERFSFVMGVKSLIVRPGGGQHLPTQSGPLQIEGLAWSGHGRIRRVEVSVDGGRTWADAQLHGPVLPQAFTRFSMPWHWRGKPATLMSRAHDETGQVQPTRREWKRRYAAHSFNHYNAIQAWQVSREGAVENTYA